MDQLPMDSTESKPAMPADDAEADQLTIPVIDETVEIGKRRVERGGVRIVKKVHERVEQVDAPLIAEQIEVQRVQVGREVDPAAPPRVRQEGDRTIIPVLEETLIVEKRLVLREEVHIVRKEQELRVPHQVTLRSEEVAVERIDGEESDPAPTSAQRQHK